MSSRSRSGRPASSRNSSNKADPDSAGGAPAHTCEAGSAGLQGASPSNTAPHNSNKAGENGFRLLRVAVDSLYLSFPGSLHAPVFAALKTLKTLAQADNPLELAQAQYVLGSHVFEVKDKGSGVFPFVLDDNAFRIQLSRPGKKLPMAYVKVSAEYLAYKGPTAALVDVLALLGVLGELNGENIVSRVDLAVDFVSPWVMDSWDRLAWVTRASRIQAHSEDQHFTGWSIGMGSDIGARLYDKTREIVRSGKDWIMPLWLPAGWASGETVWRLEFEIKREVLKELGLRSLASVLDNLDGLWSYASTEWLRLTLPNPDDATRTRWPIHPLWALLASVDWASPNQTLLARFRNSRSPDELRLVSLFHGALTSYMAKHGIDDPNQAAGLMLRAMHAHYASMAENAGIRYSELLARKVALKARGFNTAINEPGLSAAAKNLTQDAGSNAYEQASKGE